MIPSPAFPAEGGLSKKDGPSSHHLFVHRRRIGLLGQEQVVGSGQNQVMG